MKARDHFPRVQPFGADGSFRRAECCRRGAFLRRTLRLASLSLAGALAISLLSSPSAQAVLFTAGSASVAPNDTFNLPVTVSDFADVTSFQFSLSWDTGVLQFNSVGDFGMGTVAGMFGLTFTNQGKLGFGWDPQSGSPETYPSGTTVFTIQFTAVGPAGSHSYLNFTDDPTLRDVTVNFDAVPFTSQFGDVQVIPEPVTSALCVFAGLLGGIGLLRWGRNRFLRG